MWYTKQSLRRQNFGGGQNANDRNSLKLDKRIEILLYRKSKLESVSETSAVLSGFAIVALVEFSIDTYPDIPANEAVLTAYTIVSCLLVSIHLLALLMSVCILPEIKNVLNQRVQWIKHDTEVPLSAMSIYVETAWLLSTSLGLFLIILEIGLVFWIKVAGFSFVAAISAIVTLCLIGILFIIFVIGFYIRIIRAKGILHSLDLELIERGPTNNPIFMNSASVTTSSTNTTTNG